MSFETAANQFSVTISDSTGQLLLTNPHLTFGIGFVHDFEDGSGSVFINSF
jgi:hypothetical protein